MLYLIGIGLNEGGFSFEAYLAIKKSKKVYLENYTVEFPYSIKKLEKNLKKKLISVDREKVEGFDILDDAKKQDIALLVYGSPLTATTHISLIEEAKARKIKYKIIYGASILDAIAETGLQVYKFGKITSLPAWDEKKNFTPDSFMNVVKENFSIKAHTLLLIDIGLDFEKALEQIEHSAKKHNIKLAKIVVCQSLGTEKEKIIYSSVEELKKFKIKNPYCIIIPSELHFIEEESLKGFEGQ